MGIGRNGLAMQSQTYCLSTSYRRSHTHTHTHTPHTHTHAATNPRTYNPKYTHTHTHTGLVPASAICVCLYVGLLYQEMCYINVWKWMNGCWNESFDIWKVQKVSLLCCQGQCCFFEESLDWSLFSQSNLDHTVLKRKKKKKRLFLFKKKLDTVLSDFIETESRAETLHYIVKGCSLE